MKRLIGTAAALVLGLAAPLAMSALPASAAQAHSITNPSLGFDLFYPNGALAIPCERGTTWDLSRNNEDAATNNCNVRVWLNENPNGTGYNFCISPGDTVNIHRTFSEVSITGNTSRCP
jgi:hypothetical protein